MRCIFYVIFSFKYTHLVCVVHGQFVEIRKLVGPDVSRFLASVQGRECMNAEYVCVMMDEKKKEL